MLVVRLYQRGESEQGFDGGMKQFKGDSWFGRIAHTKEKEYF